MQRLTNLAVLSLLWTASAHAQGRGLEWTTPGGDAQRSAWIRTDPKISKVNMAKPGFQFLWKVKLDNQPMQLNSLTPPVTLEHYIGYRGFRALAFLGGSSDSIFALDTDLGKMEWQVHLTSTSPHQTGSLACPGGMTANVTRPVTTAFPAAAPAGRGGGNGRGGPAHSGAGEPDEGAVTIGEIAARAALARLAGVTGATGRGGFGAFGPTGATGVTGATGPSAPGGRGPFGPRPSYVYALSGDGLLHILHVSNGTESEPPLQFLPANANAQGLIVADNFAYAATSQACGAGADGVWALDLVSKQVTNWKSDGPIAGASGPALGPDGTLYVATAHGELVALQPKTLTVKDTYSAGQPFNSSPVIFQYKNKVLIAATTTDGRLHLMDTTSLGGPDHQTPIDKTPPANATDFPPSALASWQDSDGVRWVLAPTASAIAAWKVVDRDASPSLQPGWVSREIASPLPPMVVNGVVFAVASGEFHANDSKLTAAQRAQRSSGAVLYALDGATGTELWNSGKTITSFVHGGGLATGGSQVYLGAYDGTLYTFGFWIEH